MCMTHWIRHDVKILWSAFCTKSKREKLSVFRPCSCAHDSGGIIHLKMYHGMCVTWLKNSASSSTPSILHKPAAMLQINQLAQGQFVNIFTTGKHSNLKIVFYALVLRYFCLWLEVFILSYDNFQACLRDFSPDLNHTEV